MIVLAIALLLSLLAVSRPAFVVPARHPRTAHFMPYLRGDSIGALKLAKRLRFRYIDQNGLCDAEGVTWISHWPKYRKQYRWIWTGRYVGKGRAKREQRVRVPASWPEKFQHLKTAQVMKLRSARIGGRRPYRARTHFAMAAEVGIVVCLEVKNSPGFLKGDTWDRLETAQRVTGCRVIVMTLQNQGGNAAAFRRLQLAIAHGFPAALLPRGKKPADWSEKWQPLGIRQWGRWR